MLLLLLLSLVAAQGATRADYPRPEQLAQGIRRALEADARIQSELTYLERRRDVKISKLGKVTIGPLRTFEVYSGQAGGTYKRLIEVAGKPLTPAELASRDAEHERDIAKEAERQRSETPSQRAERLQKAEDERRHRSEMLDDAMAVFEAVFVGREVIAGEQVLVVDLKPRPAARPKTREGRWMKHFAGRIWVDESDYQVVRLDMRAFDDVTIGWGIIGRLHKGSRVLFSRRKVNELWLPAEMTYEASGRTLLFRPFEFTVTTTYSDYKRRGPPSQ
jgi:hypothetical protein